MVHSDDTPRIDRLLDSLRARRDLAVERATEAGLEELAAFGTVELTVDEVDQLLDLVRSQDSEIMVHEYVSGRQVRFAQESTAMIEAIEQAVAGQEGPLAEAITEILKGR